MTHFKEVWGLSSDKSIVKDLVGCCDAFAGLKLSFTPTET